MIIQRGKQHFALLLIMTGDIEKRPEFPFYTKFSGESEKSITAAWTNKQCTASRKVHHFLRGGPEDSRTELSQELGGTGSSASPSEALPSFISDLISKFDSPAVSEYDQDS